MSDARQQAKNRGGRPATGVTPARQVRIGAVWDRAEQLALDLARANGKVRSIKNRATGQEEERGDIAGYVEEALRRHNAHVERQLRKPTD